VGGGRCGKVEQGSGIGEEVVSGVLGVYASLEGVPYERDFTLGEWEGVASGDLWLLLALGMERHVNR
jgi:hypothetical protein